MLIHISGVRKAIPVIQDEGNGLFAKLENKNVSDVSLTNSDLSIKTQITGVDYWCNWCIFCKYYRYRFSVWCNI